MQLTAEQQAIISAEGNIKINAVAGSGKTTTIIEYARTRPAGSRILYLAFNKSVKLEAAKRFADVGLQQVAIHTAHSLAYGYVVFNSRYTVRKLAYTTSEIAELLRLKGSGEKHTEFVIANHINKLAAYFCNSNIQKVQELNYLDLVKEPKAKAFVALHYEYIERQTRIFLAKMDSGEIEISHDFYLKKFQLSQPVLPYDYILFDEGQDASPAMLDVFLRQQATKVIVGDIHQQIYGWRFAVNALAQAEFKTYHLSTSFRFGEDIARLATEVLEMKNHVADHQTVSIVGKGTSNSLKVKATIARTNLGLLLKAIEYVTEKRNVQQIYFEGNINSYTYADDGASLYDVLNLYNDQRGMIRDKLIRSMQDMDELEEYIDQTEDMQLGMMVEIVKEYGSRIPGIIKTIKDKHVAGDDKEKAEMIFSTVHRCKGMEYDTVQLVGDFLSEQKLVKLKEDKREASLDVAKLNEEINLLYVAVTRIKNTLNIPEMLMPKEFPTSPHIHVLNVMSEEQKRAVMAKNLNRPREKTYTREEKRGTNSEASQPWTAALDDELTTMFIEGVNLKDMVKHFGRSASAVSARIKKLDLYDLYG